MIEFTIIALSVVIAAPLTLWGVGKFLKEDRKAADDAIEAAINARPNVYPKVRDLMDYQEVNPQTGLSSKQLEISMEQNQQMAKLYSNAQKLEELEDAHESKFQKARSSLRAAERSISEMRASQAKLEGQRAAIGEAVDLATTAGRLNDAGEVIDDSGLSPQYKDAVTNGIQAWNDVADGEFMQAQTDIMAGISAEVGQIRRTIENLEQQESGTQSQATQQSEPQQDAHSETPSVSRPLTLGPVHQPKAIGPGPVSVDRAVQGGSQPPGQSPPRRQSDPPAKGKGTGGGPA